MSKRPGSAAVWGSSEPIRGPLFGPQAFARHARTLADSHVVVRRGTRVLSMPRRLDDNVDALLLGYRLLLDDVHTGRVTTPAADWLIENYYLVERAVREIRVNLPPAYFKQLPKLGGGLLDGHPRIAAVAWSYVTHTDSLVDPDELARFVRAYETRRVLQLGELWATAITLRLLLIENLRRLTDRIIEARADRRRADRFADALLPPDGSGGADTASLIAGERGRPVTRPFAVQLLRRLRGSEAGPGVDATTRWLRDGLAATGATLEEAVDEEHHVLAAATVTMRNIFTSLRTIGDVDWQAWVESVSRIERELRTSPGYREQDFATRNLHRTAIERLARGSGQDELELTRVALHLAGETPAGDVGAHVGYWLVDDGRRELARVIGFRPTWLDRRRELYRSLGSAGYVAAALVLTLLVTAVVLVAARAAGHDDRLWPLLAVAVPTLLPVSDFVLALLNHRVTGLFEARPLPGLALADGVPAELRTLVAVPTLLDTAASIDEVVDALEEHCLANFSGELYFALVTDWTDCSEPHRAGDEALVERARDAVRRLNRTHGERFLLLHRERRFAPADEVWMGWERKRGKLHELNRLLRGASDTSFTMVEGQLPPRVQYVLTLDRDTRLPRESALRLVGKISHPLNRPRGADGDGRVRRGYGILQPRVTPLLPQTEESSLFQRVFSTPSGLDPYAFAVSDVYQDLFDEGSFAGKGIYDIDAFEAATGGMFPENAVLSHDLLEGNYARSGLVTDVEVVEQYPVSYAIAASRAHRWARGDWQLLPWLTTRRRRTISSLGRWKILDNLRRMASKVAIVFALLLSLALLRTGELLVVVAALLLTQVSPPLFSWFSSLWHWRRGVTVRSQLRGLALDLGRGLAEGGLGTILLAHQAWLMADATGRAWWRMAVSRSDMLQWQTAREAAAGAGTSAGYYYGMMRGGLVPAAAALGIGAWRGGSGLVVGGVLGLLWLSAPAVAAAVSRTDERADAAPATPEVVTSLRLVARRTWHYFERFVTETEHFLPPDNFQEDPAPAIANRTSPTNIGLYLLAVVAAHDFGWVGRTEAVDRLEATLRSMSSLERYRGHLLNWYDTRTRSVLEPHYVSTVDSGNLAGHLLTLAGCCTALIGAARDEEAVRAGLTDTTALLASAITAADGSIGDDHRAQLLDGLATVRRELDGDGPLAEVAARAERLAERAEGWTRDGDEGTHEVRLWARALRHSIDSHERDGGGPATPHLDARLSALVTAARDEAMGMDFSFLLDPRRTLLAVGYQVAQAKRDDSCYDLLASEARLASFVAIAKGDVATRHWFRLGRPVVAAGGGTALMSWSGSMFEYLMPALVMHEPPAGVLHRTAQRVVRRQQQYAGGRGVPWGISESAYNVRDLDYTYQYSPFGVPGLGVSRGLGDSMVIAPYATALAAMYDPAGAEANYRRLASLGAEGIFGFYDALDFTASRNRDGESYSLVRCYMAHHQGMTVLAVHNVTHPRRLRDRFHDEAIVRAAALLLQERAPRDAPVTYATRTEGRSVHAATVLPPAADRRFVDEAVLRLTTHHLSNDHVSVTVTPAGGTRISWRGLAVNRWDTDPTCETGGDQLYFHDERSGESWTATIAPIPLAADGYDVRFSEDRAQFVRHHGTLTTDVEYRVSPETDAVLRRVTIHNEGSRARRLTVRSLSELVLGRPADDRAHPVFSRMFVRTEAFDIDEEAAGVAAGALLAHRRPRSSGEPSVWVAQLLVVDHGDSGPVFGETDRRAFLGRNGTAGAPAVLGRELAAGATGDVLDPVLSLGCSVRVRPGGSVRMNLWTLMADTREEVVELIDRHRVAGAADRAVLLSWTHSQVQLRHLGISTDEANHFQTLAGQVAFPSAALRPARHQLAVDARPQSAVWSIGVSGEVPIVLVRIDAVEDLDVVGQILRAFEHWRSKLFAVDVVILNDRTSTYADELFNELTVLVARVAPWAMSEGARGSVRVVRADQLAADTLRALNASARIVILARSGDVVGHLRRVVDAVVPLTLAPQASPGTELVVSPAFDPAPLDFFNGLGGFDRERDEYVTVLDAGRSTPAPWINVIANATFGFHASAEGAGYTWWRNSRDNQLTPWRNDPVASPMSEVVYVRQEESGAVCSPTALPIDTGRHVVRHGFGYTEYLHGRPDLGLAMSMTQFVAGDDPVKVSWLRITNHRDRPMSYAVTWVGEPVLGLDRHSTWRHLVSEVDEPTGALLVRNPWSTDYADQVAFVDLAGRQTSRTGDRSEVFGRLGHWSSPRAVAQGGPLSEATGAGLDPIMAVQQRLEVPAGETASVVVLFGAATDTAQCRELIHRYRDRDPEDLLHAEKERWRARLGAIQVHTPDAAFDVLVNGWLLYQTFAARLLARSAYYQTSGAFGFRDQLQDSMATVLVDPVTAREHLLRAAGRQFLEGDVQHWWLPSTGAGVRTSISDDVVWLARAAAHYVRVTGDRAVLDEPVRFLTGRTLRDGEHEDFFEPAQSDRTASLYEHCVLGLRRAFGTGQHGLPLMGAGDWNDGMNRVGVGGQGESVWLGWFLADTLAEFDAVACGRGDHAFAEEADAVRGRLLTALEAFGWDGAWYRRAYFDDGTPLGSVTNDACRIDAIAQSWAAICGDGRRRRAVRAMDSVHEHLVDQDEGLARLFTPPFVDSQPDPGYVQAYPPGVRENGGQYTHGAIWSIFADAALGRDDRAGALFALLNPVNHALTPEAAQRYLVEPYVVAADVYSVAPHVGRGGWTWYTGAAGWLYRAALEAILGVSLEGAGVALRPCLPPSWPEATVTIRRGLAGGTEQQLTVMIVGEPGPGRVVGSVELDGASQDLDSLRRVPRGMRRGAYHLPLPDEPGAHLVVVRLTAP